MKLYWQHHAGSPEICCSENPGWEDRKYGTGDNTMRSELALPPASPNHWVLLGCPQGLRSLHQPSKGNWWHGSLLGRGTQMPYDEVSSCYGCPVPPHFGELQSTRPMSRHSTFTGLSEHPMPSPVLTIMAIQTQVGQCPYTGLGPGQHQTMLSYPSLPTQKPSQVSSYPRERESWEVSPILFFCSAHIMLVKYNSGVQEMWEWQNQANEISTWLMPSCVRLDLIQAQRFCFGGKMKNASGKCTAKWCIVNKAIFRAEMYEMIHRHQNSTTGILSRANITSYMLFLICLYSKEMKAVLGNICAIFIHIPHTHKQDMYLVLASQNERKKKICPFN